MIYLLALLQSHIFDHTCYCILPPFDCIVVDYSPVFKKWLLPALVETNFNLIIVNYRVIQRIEKLLFHISSSRVNVPIFLSSQFLVPLLWSHRHWQLLLSCWSPLAFHKLLFGFFFLITPLNSLTELSLQLVNALWFFMEDRINRPYELVLIVNVPIE